MARVLVATQAWGVFWQPDGEANTGGGYQIKLPTGQVATINTNVYVAATGNTLVSSPWTTDENGVLPGWVEEGHWTLTINGKQFFVEVVSGTLPGRVADIEDGSSFSGSGRLLTRSNPGDAPEWTAAGIKSILDYGVDNVGLVDQAAALSALEPGTYLLPGDGFIRLDSEAVIATGVNFIGEDQGYDWPDNWPTGSIFRCMSAAGRLTFADGTGGFSSNFMVDGNNIATNAMRLRICINRIFANVLVRSSAGNNIELHGTQNCSFHRLESTRAGAACLVLDNAACSNYFHDIEFYMPGTYHIVIRNSSGIVSPAIGIAYCMNNVFFGGICEYGTATTQGVVYQTAGASNRFTGGINFSPAGAPTGNCAMFRIGPNDPGGGINGDIVIDGMMVMGDTTYWTWIDVQSNGTFSPPAARISGANQVLLCKNGVRYKAGNYMPIHISGQIDYQSVTNQYTHGDAMPGIPGGYWEYFLLLDRKFHGSSYWMAAVDNPTTRAYVRGDIVPRTQLSPQGLASGPGNAQLDTFFYRIAPTTWHLHDALQLPARSATGVPFQSLFLDVATGKLTFRDGAGADHVLY